MTVDVYIFAASHIYVLSFLLRIATKTQIYMYIYIWNSGILYELQMRMMLIII